MQSRRHEDFASQSSFDRSRRNTDIWNDSYLMMSPRSKRSWSSKMEGPAWTERVMAGRRSVSLERREFDDGSRRIRSRSPNFLEVKRGRPLYDDGWVGDREMLTPERRSRYEFFDRMDRKREDVDYSPKRNEFGYGHGSSRTGIMEDKFESRRLDGGVRDIGSQKSAVMGMYRSAGDVGPISKTETGADLSSASINIGLGQLGKERVQYPDVRDSMSLDKYTALKRYGDVEKNTVAPRNTSLSNLTASSRSKEYMDASHFKDYARTSPRNSRVDHLGYRGGIPLPRDNHPLNLAHLPEQPISYSRYEQRLDSRRDFPRDYQPLNNVRDADLVIHEDMAWYHKERFSPPRSGNLNSMRLKPRTRERDDFLYPSDEISEKMNLRERMDYNGRDVLKPRLLEAETSDSARMNMSSRSSLDHLSLEKLATNSIGLTRSPAEKRESAQYLDDANVHSHLGRKISREHKMPYMGMAQDREMERDRVDYDYNYKQELSPGSQKERRSSPPGFLYEREHNMKGRDLSQYLSSTRFLKRKYTMDEEEDRITSRSIMSKCDTVNRRHNRDFIDNEWIDQDVRGSSISRRRNLTHGSTRLLDKACDDEEFSFHDHDAFIHDHPLNPYNYEDKYARGYSRSGGRGGCNSYHPNRKNILPKWKNVHVSSVDDKEVNMYSAEIEQYEPHDDSDEFKQLVHDIFLSFTKKLNENPSVRRRYMDQGRAGSLFCIVCGRSLSKEFLDTQRLAMHAFMSHKRGLRAQHLGLLKAICVMLGWNSVIPVGTIRWFPEPLSSTETSVQKEDLIIWPPIIIVHNTSIWNNDSNGKGPTTIEALGQFLRGVGLSGGKVKLGKPANCSIMLVKFLGTFSALQEAEKIHQYFAKNKHGRKDLDRINSSKGKSKSSNSVEGENRNGDKEAERVLFGYMGIAEDLDKVDVDTKRKCSIKSKKEIQDLADGPVKPE